ncbi:MAG: trigger factor [Saprospiraceae bacterium]
MKFDLNHIDDLNARLTLVIERSDYEGKLEENIKNYSKKLNMKGFRAGKTPKSVLTKMYGKGLLEETVTTMLNDSLLKYLDDEKVEIFGSPMLAPDAEVIDFNPKAPTDYTFHFDLGMKPLVDINLNYDTPLDVMTVAADHAALDEEIQRYRRMFGEEDEIEDGAIESNDRVTVMFNPNSENNTSAPEEDPETVIDLERNKGEAAELLPGMKKGDKLEVDLEKFLGYPRQSIVKNILSLDEDPALDAPLLYKAEIIRIGRPQENELTEEQLAKYVGPQIKDEATLRSMLESRDTNNNATRLSDMKKMAVRAALLKANSFAIPEEFLLRWVNSQREQKLVMGTKEANNLFRDAKWSFLLHKIVTENSLEVTDKDIQKQVVEWVTANVDYRKADMRKVMKELYANEYFMSTMKENALEDVVFNHILPNFQFNEKKVNRDEFEHAFHDMHHELFDHGDHSHQ